MLKLYLIVWIGGVVGGTVGPLPYDIDECFRRSDEMNLESREKHPNSPLWFDCEERVKRPRNNKYALVPFDVEWINGR